jgi:hypothetical protein
MSPPTVVAPLLPEQVPDLRQFLMNGFDEPPDAEVFSLAALRWKYFDDYGVGDPPRSFVTLDGDRITGHIGLCQRSFHSRSQEIPGVPTVHPIDWLGSPRDPLAGIRLLYKVFERVETLYAVGGTLWAQRALAAAGSQHLPPVRVYLIVLNPGYRLRQRSGSLLRRSAGAIRDVIRVYRHPAQAAQQRFSLSHVGAFDSEVDSVLANAPARLMFTSRTAALLNYYLRYPGGTFSGWQIYDHQRLRGFALLRIRRRRHICEGRIVDCFLDSEEVGCWHAALSALSHELRRSSVDYATVYVTAPWFREAAERSGFFLLHETNVLMRDPRHRVSCAAPFMLSMLEADHAIL